MGGDTYWCRSEGSRSLLALADCTGHGVPGALMTMALHSILDGMPWSLEALNPSEAAAYVHERLRITLGQGEADSLANDGADLALILIDRDARRIVFCGARMPLFVETDGSVTVCRGGPHSVGYAHGRGVAFHDEELRLDPSAVYYLTTDGLLDQNAEAGKGGIGRSGFVSLIATQAGLSMRGREAGILRFIGERLTGTEQRDDITVVAFTIR